MGDFSQIFVSFSEYLNFIIILFVKKQECSSFFVYSSNRLNLAFSKTNPCFFKNGPSKQQYSKHHPANTYAHSWVKIFHNSDVFDVFSNPHFQDYFFHSSKSMSRISGNNSYKTEKIAFKKFNIIKNLNPYWLTYVKSVLSR